MNAAHRTPAAGEPRRHPDDLQPSARSSSPRSTARTTAATRSRCCAPCRSTHLCAKKTIWIGDGELIVGERGPRPKAVPTYPELTCHSVEDLRILDSRPKTSYAVAPEVPRGLRARRSSRSGAAAPCATGSSRRSRPSGTRPTGPASSPSSWSSGRPATRSSTTRSTGGACSTSRPTSRPALAALDYRARPRGLRQARGAPRHGHRLRGGDPLRGAPRRRSPSRAGGGRDRPRRAAPSS